MKNKRKSVSSINEHSEAVSEAESTISITKKSMNVYRRAVWTCFKEYCSNSSIHGVRYLGESKRPAFERLWWIIAFGISLGFCGHLILKVWQKWDESPVIVSFSEKSTPVWKIPFPAVTICSETKADPDIINFTEAFHYKFPEDESNMTEKEEEMLTNYKALSLVCDFPPMKRNFTGNSSTVETLNKISPTVSDLMLTCKWRNEEYKCKDLFSRILTEEGVCYTFNILDASELLKEEAIQDEYEYHNHGKKSQGWTLEDGYPANLTAETYPQRGPGAGAKEGLEITFISTDNDLDYLCKGPVQGYRVLLHHPAAIPRLSELYFRVPLKQEVIVSVRPNMMTTSEGLHAYAPHRRQCYLPHERKLHFYHLYTQTNCELECLTNYTLKICGCVNFSMPRNKSTPICGTRRKHCVSKAHSELQAKEIAQELHGEQMHPGKRGKTDCDCLPSCTSIQYDAETSQAKLNLKQTLKAYKMDMGLFANLTMSQISIYFKEAQFITSKRSELYGFTDFLANCGGLLGLFMGVSILSIVEIIYFLTLRLFCTLRIRARKMEKCHLKENLTNGNNLPHNEKKY